MGLHVFTSQCLTHHQTDCKEIYSSSIIKQHRPLLEMFGLTADGDAQLHSSPFGKFNVEGAAARNHRL